MKINKNLSVDTLLEIASSKKENILIKGGPLCTYTGDITGRSPTAKKIVYDEFTAQLVDWSNNEKITEEAYSKLYKDFLFFKNNAKTYSQNVYAVRDPKYKVSFRIYTQHARHSLFVRNMFIPTDDPSFTAKWEILQFPSLKEKPIVAISFKHRQILISGTLYSGEIKKSAFTVLNYLFPLFNDALPMHCSVNVDLKRKNPAIFFGLSGTGKTTLSSDPSRILIGDDEHAWTESGLTNFEGGCYAKTVKLSKKQEPQIWDACHKKGAMLENVAMENSKLNFDNTILTENGRASYPTSFISGADKLGYVKEHPKNIIMLTCDAFGVLPAVAKLTPDDAVYQFLLGYTAKVAGTEKGVTEPQATFSPCFGLPFMPLPPKVYADLLKRNIKKHKVNCWLVNTGWSGGPYGVGQRISLAVTRAIIDSILDGSLANCQVVKHKPTNFTIPITPAISSEYLFPEMSWEDKQDYKATLARLKKKINLYNQS